METFFWVLSKLLWNLLAPEKVVLILLFLGTCFLWSRWQTAGRWMISLATVILLIPSVLPLNNFLLWPLEERFPPPAELPEKVAGIIVLGGSEIAVVTEARGQPSLNKGAERLINFVALARRYPEARLIYAGGAGGLNKQDHKSSGTAEKLFLQLGLDTGRVLFDSNARNTAENVVNSFNLVDRKPDGDWILVTSAYHIPRAVGLFRKIGWDVIPYPVDYQTTGQLKYDWDFAKLDNFLGFSKALHEWLGLIAYRLTGKTSELFPKPIP